MLGDAEGSAEAASALTDEQYWDSYWEEAKLPLEVTREPRNHYLDAILDVFDRYLPREPDKSVLEIGGSPGQYLAYLKRNFGYAVHCIDFSAVGCEKTCENFERLGIEGRVHQGDALAENLAIGPFDIVYSLGFVEHFGDLCSVVAAHRRLTAPGGLIVLGMPSFLGVNRWFLERLAPRMLATHNLESMQVDRWERFERALDLTPLFKGYVGGFEPGLLTRCEEKTFSTRAVRLIPKLLHATIGKHAGWLRRFNSPRWSGYAMGVYRAPESPVPASDSRDVAKAE